MLSAWGRATTGRETVPMPLDSSFLLNPSVLLTCCLKPVESPRWGTLPRNACTPGRSPRQTDAQTKLGYSLESAACLEGPESSGNCKKGAWSRLEAIAILAPRAARERGRFPHRMGVQTKLGCPLESVACLERLPGRPPCENQRQVGSAKICGRISELLGRASPAGSDESGIPWLGITVGNNRHEGRAPSIRASRVRRRVFP